MRQTTSLPGPTSGTIFFTSSADSQLMTVPSPARPARRSMPGRRAATRIGGMTAGGRSRRKPLTLNVSYSRSTFSPVRASFKKRTMSRLRL